MRHHQLLRLASMRRQLRFIDEHPALLGALRHSREYLAIDHAVRSLARLALEQRHTANEVGRHLQLRDARRHERWSRPMKPLLTLTAAGDDVPLVAQRLMRLRHHWATRQVAHQLSNAGSAVRMLDRTVSTRLGGRRELLDAWRLAKAVGRPLRALFGKRGAA